MTDSNDSNDAAAPPAPDAQKRLLVIGAAAAAVLLLGGWIFLAFIESDEAKIRKLMAELAGAATERDTGGVLDTLTEDFSARWGNKKDTVDRDAAKQGLTYFFLVEYKGGLQVQTDPPTESLPVEVAADGKTATCTLTFTVRGRRRANTPWEEANTRTPVRGQATVDVELRKTDGGWKIAKMVGQR